MLFDRTRRLLLAATVAALATAPGATPAQAETNMRLADSLGVIGTPTFFYQGGGHVGLVSLDELREILDLD